MPNKNQQAIKIQSSKYMNSLFVGNFKASFAGKGVEFQDFREYSPGDDAKYIDWARSSMESSMVMRRYKEEKNSDIYCYLDMRESLDFQDGIKRDLLHTITEFIYQAAKASGEKFGGFIDIKDGIRYISPMRNPQSLKSLNNFSGNFHTSEEFLDVSPLMNPKLKRSIIFIISDSMNIDEKSFKSACKKHDIIYIFISSHFEDTLSDDGISLLRGIGGNIAINLDDNDKKNEYMQLKQRQKDDFSSRLRKLGSDTMFVNEESSLVGAFLKLMKKRMNFAQ